MITYHNGTERYLQDDIQLPYDLQVFSKNFTSINVHIGMTQIFPSL